MGVLKNTPLFEEHLELGAKMVPFSGWSMPVQYPGGILGEHRHTRSACSVFDICHMGEYQVAGEGAGAALDGIFARRVSDLPIGFCRYNLLLNETGGVLDDLIVYRMAETDFFIVVNAGNIASDAAWIAGHLPDAVKLNDLSERLAKLDLQGPGAAEVLGKLGVDPAGLPRYYHWVMQEIAGTRCILSRTGYTGELGFELYFDADSAVAMWRRMLETAPVKPAGLGARDTLRLEMGYALYGHELRRDWTPLDCSLGGLLKLSDGRDFIGRSSLLAQKVHRTAVAVKLDGRRVARAETAVLGAGGTPVGVVTSGAFAPSLEVSCALCSLEPGVEVKIGDHLKFAVSGAELTGTVVETPFNSATSLRKAVAVK